MDDNVAQLVRRIRFVYKIASVGGAFAAFDETARVRQSCGLPASSGDESGAKEYFDSITAVPIGGGVHSDLRGDPPPPPSGELPSFSETLLCRYSLSRAGAPRFCPHSLHGRLRLGSECNAGASFVDVVIKIWLAQFWLLPFGGEWDILTGIVLQNPFFGFFVLGSDQTQTH